MTMNPTEKALFRIDYDGRWFHDGGEIKRAALAKLFSDRGLRVDDTGGYWLQSPESRYPVEVEDVPYVIVDYDIQNPGPGQSVTIITNMGESVVLDADHRLELRAEPRGGAVVPYLDIRYGLYARVGRAVYYKLVALADHHHDKITLRSRGVDHDLGLMEQE